jgi:predicted enzyme related to lactoylglutathione lyase
MLARMANNTGRLVWYELLTSDPKAAIAFYTEVLGWKTQQWEQGGDYTMFVGSQGPLGGVSLLPEKAKAMGAPPYWSANVIVANVDESAARVKQLGGTIHHVEAVPTIGKLAVIADPQGATLTLFQPESEMAQHDIDKHGEFSWHELYTTDANAALSFYSQIAGWQKLGEFDMGAMGPYILWGREGRQLGGMMKMPPTMKTPDGRPIPPNWMYYVTVDDLDGTLARAKDKGAKVLNGPMDVPGGQRIVQLMDPQGAAFAIVTAPKK